MEAEIEEFKIDDPDFVSAPIGDGAVQVIVASRAIDLTNVKPIIKISPNARISPSLDEPQDFTKKVVYTVVSEDGKYSRTYTINVVYPPSSGFLKFDFENWTTVGIWKYPHYKDLEYDLWNTANNGVAWAHGFGAKNVHYPTRDTTDAYSGAKAALLETVKGKYVSIAKLNIPIFSGSLFLGQFALNQNEPLKSTKFGQSHPKEAGRPVLFEGYYKYQPGAEFLVDEKVVPGKVDEFDIYAILYKYERTYDEKGDEIDFTLDGTSMSPNTEYCVAVAEVKDKTPKDEYTKFEVVFDYKDRSKFNYVKYNYKFAIILASSTRGAHYEGAIGSKLIVDELKITFEEWTK